MVQLFVLFTGLGGQQFKFYWTENATRVSSSLLRNTKVEGKESNTTSPTDLFIPILQDV